MLLSQLSRRSLDEESRDAYGFAVRPQHLQRYREHANIYKEEEEERSDRWKHFLERQAESDHLLANGLPKEGENTISQVEATVQEAETVAEVVVEADLSIRKSLVECSADNVPEKEEVAAAKETKTHKIQIWAQIRPSLGAIEHMMSLRVTKTRNLSQDEIETVSRNHLAPIEEARPPKGASEEDSEEEFYDVERSDPIQDASSIDSVNSYGPVSAGGDGVPPEQFFPWKEELECLVRGGVPMALRGELWQAFVGVRARRTEKYYQDLLAPKMNAHLDKDLDNSLSNNTSKGSDTDRSCAPEKWKGQIEKDLPRTFPGHPALDEDGRNALRRLLTAYARHNPSVGYCQAMNFFAGLLLLLMPEENAFWTLMGIIDDYFDGYYSEEMIESQNHRHAERRCVHFGRAGAAENGSIVFPIENMSLSGASFSSHWNSVPRSNEYSSISLSMEVPHYQPATSGPSYGPLLHQSAAGSFCPITQNYAHHASSSSYSRHTIHGVEGGVVGPTVGSVRGPSKRKSPVASMVCEGGSSSRYYTAGSSSDLSISSNLQQEKSNFLSQHWSCNSIGINPSYNSLSTGSECSQRNVRRCSTLDLGANLARTHLSSNSYRHPHSTGCPINHSGTIDLAGLSANATTQAWNLNPTSPAAHGRILSSDTRGLSHKTNQFLVGECSTNSSVEIGGYRHDFISSRNPVVAPPNLHGTLTQAVRGSCNSYFQRPAYRATSSYPRVGHVATSSEDGRQLASETYSFRHSRSLPPVGWRNSDRNGRSRLSNESRSLTDEANSHDRLLSEGLMIVDRSALYGSRNLHDQHREMRLDIDNMSYEELLALGERIGNVSTGLSEDLISKCLIETIYCSSDQIHEEGTCVICLEDYKNKEDVGTLKNCSHNYHVDCIKKWLLMKNVCPICKKPALADD